jgi:phage host-nuclease inhibitor protein Gam
MPKITVDGIEYNTEDLTDNGKAQLASLQFLEVQMNKLKNEIAVFQTAKQAYVNALKAELEKDAG